MRKTYIPRQIVSIAKVFFYLVMLVIAPVMVPASRPAVAKSVASPAKSAPAVLYPADQHVPGFTIQNTVVRPSVGFQGIVEITGPCNPCNLHVMGSGGIDYHIGGITLGDGATRPINLKTNLDLKVNDYLQLVLTDDNGIVTSNANTLVVAGDKNQVSYTLRIIACGVFEITPLADPLTDINVPLENFIFTKDLGQLPTGVPVRVELPVEHLYLPGTSPLDWIPFDINGSDPTNLTLPRHLQELVPSRWFECRTLPTPTVAPTLQATPTTPATATSLPTDIPTVAPTATREPSPTATATTPPVVTKSLQLTKSADRTSYTFVGDVINYQYVAKNTGKTTLNSPFTVEDDKTTVQCDPTKTSLAPGDSILCVSYHQVVQADIDRLFITNKAIAKADGAVSNEAQVTVFFVIHQIDLPLIAKATANTAPAACAGMFVQVDSNMTGSQKYPLTLGPHYEPHDAGIVSIYQHYFFTALSFAPTTARWWQDSYEDIGAKYVELKDENGVWRADIKLTGYHSSDVEKMKAQARTPVDGDHITQIAFIKGQVFFEGRDSLGNVCGISFVQVYDPDVPVFSASNPVIAANFPITTSVTITQ